MSWRWWPFSWRLTIWQFTGFLLIYRIVCYSGSFWRIGWLDSQLGDIKLEHVPPRSGWIAESSYCMWFWEKREILCDIIYWLFPSYTYQISLYRDWKCTLDVSLMINLLYLSCFDKLWHIQKSGPNCPWLCAWQAAAGYGLQWWLLVKFWEVSR